MLKDQDIREPLFDFFDEKFGKVRIIEEKQIAKSRADALSSRISTSGFLTIALAIVSLCL